jgi:CSLREA domain-containing protein
MSAFFRRLLRILVVGAFLALTVWDTPLPARAATVITVNTTNDDVGDDGLCSLREAIIAANTETASGGSIGECATGSGADIIVFDSSLSGETITLASDLSEITADLTIDGSALASQIMIHGNDNYAIISITNQGAIVSLKNLIITHGYSHYNPIGSGIYNKGTLTVVDSTIRDNYAILGGGIANEGDLTVMSSNFINNEAAILGGGIINFPSATLTVSNSTFRNNTAYEEGGGIRVEGAATIINSTFNGNSANEGGAIAIFGTTTVTNSTFSGNTASSMGGGIYNTNVLAMANTIVADSASGGDCANDGGMISLNDHNLVEDGSCSPALSGDPGLGALADNGGATETMAIGPASPAIDAGDAGDCPATDQRGIFRPQGMGCDIGAFESEEYPIAVTFTSAGANDGYLLESSENSNKGGSGSAAGGMIVVGDGLSDRQYRGVLHFDTSGLPDDAVITGLTLQIKRQGVTGSDPFTILGNLTVSIRAPYFGSSAGLAISDFQAAADAPAGNFDPTLLPGDWYSATLDLAAFPFVNLTGTTQLRLAFSLDDNDDGGTDYLKFYSGNNSTTSYRPALIVEYYVP